MADDPTDYILGDAAIDALEQPKKKRRIFRRRKAAPRITHCENCSTPLHGEYCSACGQHAIDYRRSLWSLLVDAADSFLNWDTKFLQTTQILLTRPWKLTNDFNAGRRVRYAHPLRLYLLASIAFFLLAKLVPFSTVDERRAVELTPKDRAEIEATLSKLTAPDSPVPPEYRPRLEAARARWATPDANATPEQQNVVNKSMLRLLRFAERKNFRPQDRVRLDTALARIEASGAPPPQYAGEPGVEPSAIGPPLPPKPAPRKYGPFIQFDAKDAEAEGSFAAWLEARVKEKIGEDGTNAQLFLETLRNNIPTMMLFCIPLFALVLKVLYIRQCRFYIEHLVYAAHIHSFVYLAVIVITLSSMAVERTLPGFRVPLTLLLSFVVVALVFVSIRRVYRQGWAMTIFKFLLGAIIYLWVLSLALVATVFATLLSP